MLLEAGIHVLKEMPAAESVDELRNFQHLAEVRGVRLVTAGQNPFGAKLQIAKEWLPFLGTTFSIEATQKVSIPMKSLGWNEQHKLVKGGVLEDLAWRLLSDIVGIMGADSSFAPIRCKSIHTRGHQAYDYEDGTEAGLIIQPAGRSSISARLVLSLVGIYGGY